MEFLTKDYTVIANLLYLFAVLSAIIFIRYLILSGAYHQLIYRSISKKWPFRIISPRYPRSQQNREIMWSGISSVLFGAIAVLMIMAWQKGYTAIYMEWNAYPLWYIPVSVFLALAIHETYYYWVHRWLHHPLLFRHIHKVHHNSISTSVWTSFSFHPVESILQAIIIPAIALVIPLHLSVFVFLLLFMTITAIINHAGVEIYPASWRKNPLMKWLIGSTHHDIHHRRFTKNFGLYFTCWDQWMDTESDEYAERFMRATTLEKNELPHATR